MITKAASLIYLFSSLYFSMRNKPSMARAALDRSTGRLPKRLDFIEAYDARVLMMEGRHEEAIRILRLTLEAFKNRTDDNGNYVWLYCEHFLSIYGGEKGALDTKMQAEQLAPSDYIPKFLPFFSDDSVARIMNVANDDKS